jgi:HK97 family phage major capsid protein
MSDFSEIKKMLDETADQFTRFRAHNDPRLEDLSLTVAGMQAGVVRTALSGGATGNVRVSSDGFFQSKDSKLADALRRMFHGDELELKAMAVGDDPSGGFLVVPALSAGMTVVEQDFSPLRQLARVIPIEQGDAYEEPVDKDTATATWVGEQQARPATATPQIAMLRIPVHEIYAMPEATQNFIDDARFNIVTWLTEKVGRQFGVAEGTAFLAGSGVSKPRGLLTYPTAATPDASRAWGTLEHVATGTSGGFGADPAGANKLIDVVHSLKAGYRKGGVWLMNKKTVGEVRKLKDTSGRFVWVDSLIPGTPPSLLGYVVVEAEDMPDIAANSLSIAFGNFARGYTIIDRLGVRFLHDPFTNKPLVRLYTTKRVGGDVNDFHAVKLLKFA